MKWKCKYCSTENPAINDFCGKCGRPVRNEAVAKVEREIIDNLETIVDSRVKSKFGAFKDRIKDDVDKRFDERMDKAIIFIKYGLFFLVPGMGIVGYGLLNVHEARNDVIEIRNDAKARAEEIKDELDGVVDYAKEKIDEVKANADQIRRLRTELAIRNDRLGITSDEEDDLKKRFVKFHKYLVGIGLVPVGKGRLNVFVRSRVLEKINPDLTEGSMHGFDDPRRIFAILDEGENSIEVFHSAYGHLNEAFSQYTVDFLKDGLGQDWGNPGDRENNNKLKAFDMLAGTIADYIVCSYGEGVPESYCGYLKDKGSGKQSELGIKAAFNTKEPYWPSILWDVRTEMGEAKAGEKGVDVKVIKAWKSMGIDDFSKDRNLNFAKKILEEVGGKKSDISAITTILKKYKVDIS